GVPDAARRRAGDDRPGDVAAVVVAPAEEALAAVGDRLAVHAEALPRSGGTVGMLHQPFVHRRRGVELLHRGARDQRGLRDRLFDLLPERRRQRVERHEAGRCGGGGGFGAELRRLGGPGTLGKSNGGTSERDEATQGDAGGQHRGPSEDGDSIRPSHYSSPGKSRRSEGFRRPVRLAFRAAASSPIFRRVSPGPWMDPPMRRKLISAAIVLLIALVAGGLLARKPLLARFYVR